MLLLKMLLKESALKSKKAHIFGDIYMLSNSFIKDICDCMVKEMETLGVSGSSGALVSGDSQVVNEAKAGHDSSRLNESTEMGTDVSANRHGDKGSKKKKGKASGNAAVTASDSGPDNQEQTSTKSKKSHRRGKDTSTSQISDSKSGSRKDSLKMKEDLSRPSEEWIMDKIITLFPEFEEQGLLIHIWSF